MAERGRPHVVLEAGPLGVQAWPVIGGLYELARAGQIRLSRTPAPSGASSQLVVATIAGRRVAFDLADGPECDTGSAPLIFKRSHRPPLPEQIRPLGLTSCYRTRTDPGLFRYVVTSMRTALRRGISAARQLHPPPLQLTQFAPRAKSGAILYQVRAWDPAVGSDGEDRTRVNEDRAAIIRALRGHFGPNFRGGFVPDAYSSAHYPDLLTALPTAPSAYAQLVGSASVAVSSVGLHGSVPWKLVEYLAAGCAIVSPPLTATLPEPLDLLTFQGTDACIAQVETAQRLAPEIGARSRRYYEANVEPSALMANRIAEVLAT